MSRTSNRIVVAVVASAFLLLGSGCSSKDNKSGNASDVDEVDPPDVDDEIDPIPPDEDPTVFPDPAGGVPSVLDTAALPDPTSLPADNPTPSQIAAATAAWAPKSAAEIQALILREAEADGDPTQAEIDALDLLYKNTPTPPDPGQL
ncbi:MAG: hypothetical protein JRG89_17780 [Deltaproteobacteria bacterium]|nr:hypothetical protein [Deltaproteobacteria bacterium]MBW2390256.1 hypothetical protein [Deltaproteobacteria bacterium]MBW2723165.1 hypothetical protein [Deltaproteobacteria bacterium]